MAAEEEWRLGVAGADLLRLPTIRVQLRLMEVGLVDWRHGQAAAATKLVETMAAWQRIELYDAGFATVVRLVLAWEAGTLTGEPLPEDFAFERSVWDAVRAVAGGDHDRAASLVTQRLARKGPVVWSTLAHETVLAHAVADLGLRAHVNDLLGRLSPHTGRLAGMGQGPIAGPVDLALARLHQLAGDRETALRLAASARRLAERQGGTRWAERAAALQSELAKPD